MAIQRDLTVGVGNVVLLAKHFDIGVFRRNIVFEVLELYANYIIHSLSLYIYICVKTTPESSPG